MWRDKHEAAVLMRAATLVYLRAKTGIGSQLRHGGGGEDGAGEDEAESDVAASAASLRSALESFLRLSAKRACRPEVMRQLEGGKARELLVAAAHLGCTFPQALSLAILEELIRDSGADMTAGSRL